MKVDIQHLPHSEVKIRVEVDPDIYEKEKKRVLLELQVSAVLPGFRPGKAPFDLIEKKIGLANLQAQILEKLLPLTYRRVVEEHHLQVASKPHIDIVSEEPLCYEATVALLPQVEIKDLDKIQISRKKIEVKESDVEAVVLDIQKQYATYQDVDRPAQKGDKVEVDFEAFDDKKVSLPDVGSKNHPFILGEGFFILEFEENIIGMKQGEKRIFTVSFQKDFRYKPFRDKKITFEVYLHKVQEVLLPNFDEIFIDHHLGQKQTVLEYKADIRRSLERFHEDEERRRRENEFIEKLLQASHIDISDMLILPEIDFIKETLTMDLKHRGVDFAHYVRFLEEKGQNLEKNIREEARRRVLSRLILQHLIAEKGFTVSDQELEEGKKREGFKDFDDVQMKNQLLLQKLFDHYLNFST